MFEVFALFARGAKSRRPNFPFTSPFPTTLPADDTHNMAAEMGPVITIDNFATKMSSFDPSHTENHLYGLVDMGRYSPMPACSRAVRSNAPK